jgi:hypothetical protein
MASFEPRITVFESVRRDFARLSKRTQSQQIGQPLRFSTMHRREHGPPFTSMCNAEGLKNCRLPYRGPRYGRNSAPMPVYMEPCTIRPRRLSGCDANFREEDQRAPTVKLKETVRVSTGFVTFLNRAKIISDMSCSRPHGLFLLPRRVSFCLPTVATSVRL